MDTDLQAKVEISLSTSAWLVLFELLTMSYEKWREANPDDDAVAPMTISAISNADRKAVLQLEGALERTLPELFASNYAELLAISRKLLECS